MSLVAGRKLPRSTRIGFAEDVRWHRHDVATRREHGRVSQPALDELEADEPVVHAREGRPESSIMSRSYPFARQLVHQRGDQVRRVSAGRRPRRSGRLEHTQGLCRCAVVQSLR